MLSIKQLNALIAKIAKSAAGLRKDIDTACKSAAFHHATTGDVTPLNTLVKATESVVSRNAVRVWFDKHAAVTWNNETKEFDHSPKRLEDRVGAPKVDLLTADMKAAYEGKLTDAKSYDAETKPEQDFKPFNFAAILAAAKKRVEGMTDEQKADKRNNFALYQEAMNLLDRAEAERKSNVPFHRVAKPSASKTPRQRKAKIKAELASTQEAA